MCGHMEALSANQVRDSRLCFGEGAWITGHSEVVRLGESRFDRKPNSHEAASHAFPRDQIKWVKRGESYWISMVVTLSAGRVMVREEPLAGLGGSASIVSSRLPTAGQWHRIGFEP